LIKCPEYLITGNERKKNILLYELYREGLRNSPDKPALIVDDAICTCQELHKAIEGGSGSSPERLIP